jgi:hypothetical protein
MVPLNSISNLILLPSHTTSKKEGEDYFAVIFQAKGDNGSAGVTISGKEVKHLLFNLSKTLPNQGKGASKVDLSEGFNTIDENNGVVVQQTESEKFSQALSHAASMIIQKNDARLFRTVSSSKPFLRCHRGTQEGAIYPLECGIVFIKPLLFIPADIIASLTAGRGGGSGNTRFVDLKVSAVDVD